METLHAIFASLLESAICTLVSKELYLVGLERRLWVPLQVEVDRIVFGKRNVESLCVQLAVGALSRLFACFSSLGESGDAAR